MADKRMCYFIPVEGYIKDEGWRPSVVFEGESGHIPTGVWPYDVSKPRPYFWGHDFEAAQLIASEQNARLGHSENDVVEIIASSLGASSNDLTLVKDELQDLGASAGGFHD